ncbi:protein-tyrosine phosphatase [Saitoella complicata NRRL Y-17804]|uniref:protein-tyrosine phosphatase n=1 Tax=Saitoella complicata (strain BCRC 22490 / CBS 7301 / JCM 7358 / NBRC 10748 / NRRL Y-17804) TaxID=698492 RepID=UPI0008671F6F|nr:protein-tyrosine phosphatase [Saitoella complicata NRRL Y-17804]ODQ55530.1 protein-tyrosine phosphatase [Saitoella complicata NRRL Y-17804]
MNMTVDNVLVPPISFAMVAPGVYRSGHPLRLNFKFLEKRKFKTIIYIADQDYDPETIAFCTTHNITLHLNPLPPTKEPFQTLSSSSNSTHSITHALSLLLDTRNHPVLIHSNKGKHRVGVVVACLRKLQGWSLASVFDEYARFAGGSKGEVEVEYKPEWL